MQERKISKYLAYVYGNLSNEGTIDYPISRHKTNRKKMAVNNDGKKAITNYKVEKNYENYFTKIKLSLVTGRTPNKELLYGIYWPSFIRWRDVCIKKKI